MPRASFTSSDGRPIEIEYDSFGDPSRPTLLLVMGFGAQMVAWDERFCRLLAERDLHVVRFDNRDCGLSTKLDGVAVDVDAVIRAAVMEEPPPPVPYLLSDMGNDAFAVLDDLGVAHAHVMGASMGGMIAQTMAIEHPERTLSLISVMSQPGDITVGQPTPEAMAALVAVPPSTRDDYVEFSRTWQVFQSRKYRSDEVSRRNAARDFDRSFYPDGAPRQMAAIYASGNRSDALRNLRVPTLVIHGTDDTLITPSGGERTAELIPGARYLLVEDMGHDLPEPLWPTIVEEIDAHVSAVAPR